MPENLPPSPRGDGMDESDSRASLLSFNFTAGLTPSWLRGSSGSVFAELPSLGFQNSGAGPLLTPSMGAYLETLISPPVPEATAGPTPSPAETAALEQWARIAGKPFAAETVANPEARRFAVRLADSIVRILGDRRHEEPIGDLGVHGHALIERSPAWPPERVEAVHHLVDRLERSASREFGLFLLLVQDLEAASRPQQPEAQKAGNSPGGLWRQFCSAAAGYGPGPPPRPAADGRSNAARFFQTFLRNVRRAAGQAPLAFSGYFVAEYDPATLDLALTRASMAAAARAILGPARRPGKPVADFWSDFGRFCSKLHQESSFLDRRTSGGEY